MSNKQQDLIAGYTNNDKPIIVFLKRGESVESIHRVHAVVCDTKGRVLISAGNNNYESFIRSAFKPFQALPFISSGASQSIKTGEKGLAIASSSHNGSAKHAREAFKILWNADIDVSALKCPVPIDKQSKLEHNCSGKHAAFLATCKKMNWPQQNYLERNHPIQQEIIRKASEILKIAPEEIITETDDCGAPTLLLKIKEMATLYAHLSSSNHQDLEQIRRSIIKHPYLISGEGEFDTELMNRSHGQIISKGGAEGIQCLGRIGEGLGLAIKVEDGSKRAKHATAIHLLKQLEWATPTAIKEIESEVLSDKPKTYLEVNGELAFQENLIKRS
tara:strand:- start:77 stop:1072 length:996 start_codon:yes stop_codon:yes gene_type:complete